MGAEPAGKRLPVRDPGDEFDDFAGLLNGLLGRIEASLEEERRFAAEAAHELRSPLSVLRLRAEQALGSKDPATVAAALEGILADADRIHRLVQALLELSRAGGGAEAPADPVDAASVLGAMEEDFRTLAASRGLEFRFSGFPAPARAATTREVLETCVSVLVDNALRYTPRGGSVVLEAAAEGGRLRVRVRDSGPGVPAAEAGQVFDRMFRGKAGKESRSGFGLGLTLARRLARSSKGDVLLENPGQPGACFAVDLPLV